MAMDTIKIVISMVLLNVTIVTDESGVLCIEVSLIQRCPYREVPTESQFLNTTTICVGVCGNSFILCIYFNYVHITFPSI